MNAHRFLVPAIALLAASPFAAHGAIVTSGLRDIVVTYDLDGVYLDVDAGTTATSETIGWDINPFLGGEAVGNSPSFQPVRMTVAVDSAIVDLAPGHLVDGTAPYASDPAGSGDHIGNGPDQFANGAEGYIGFKFSPNGSASVFYGWMRLVLRYDGGTGLIRDWAFDNTGSAITVGAVPEPTSPLLLLAGCAATLGLHRRRASQG